MCLVTVVPVMACTLIVKRLQCQKQRRSIAAGLRMQLGSYVSETMILEKHLC